MGQLKRMFFWLGSFSLLIFVFVIASLYTLYLINNACNNVCPPSHFKKLIIAGYFNSDANA